MTKNQLSALQVALICLDQMSRQFLRSITDDFDDASSLCNILDASSAELENIVETLQPIVKQLETEMTP